MKILQFQDVELAYGKHIVLSGVNLELKKGEFFGLVGPNGSGKSTLLKSLLGLIKPNSGEINWHTDSFKKGYVPQRERVDPIWPISVRNLISLTLSAAISPWRHQRGEVEQVDRVMELTKTAEFANKTLDTLSGGEIQRVLLARALVVEPDILLLDEPTAAMDIVAVQRFLSLITDIHTKSDMTIIMVTHDLNSLIDRADRLGILQHGSLYSGPASEILTTSSLSSIFREPMTVKVFEGRQHIIHGL